MVNSRPHFSKEFKLRICRELESGSSVAEVARRHQVHPKLVYNWASQYRKNPAAAFGTGNGRKTAAVPSESVDDRVAELERIVGRLTLENEFLKKTLRTVETTFGRVPPKDGTR